jgi:class 3 adenylate cyclase/tetratricopeptide (TPR) repeat protein
MATCSSCGQENRTGARFCDACGAPLDGGRSDVREVRKTVTVVFSDVVSSTALGERLDPESLRRVMSRYFDEVRTVLDRHGGTVEKFIGDAVMAVFGVPTLHEDDALRAVRAAVEIREALQALNAELEYERGVRISARIGIGTGEVVAGNASSSQAFVSGDAVNVAARLEQAAQPGSILVDEPTYELVKDAAAAEPVDALWLKGKAEPVRAFRLVTVAPAVAARRRRLDSAMVGRHRELLRLEATFEQAIGDRSCQLFTILGAAGVGKSRLAEEFLGGVGTNALVVRGRCLSYGDGITFFPLAQIVGEAADLAEDETPGAALTKIARLVREEQDGELVARRVAELIGLGEATLGAEESFAAVRRLFEVLAGPQPLVMVFDDLHWAEPMLLELVEYVADWSRDAPILVLCIARPELLDIRPHWAGGKLNATSLLLEPLRDEDCERLVRNLLGQAELPHDVVSRITAAAEGNPLFVEELMAVLIEEGVLSRRDGTWIARGDLSSIHVPRTISALLAARLDRLDEGERTLLQRAAIEGKQFHLGAIFELYPEAAPESVRAQLQALVRAELIRPDRARFGGEQAFRFRHLLIRDAAYESMPKETRAALHERYADWLEGRAGERMSEYEEFVGYHLEQAHRYLAELGPVDDSGSLLARRAAQLLASAGRRAGGRDDWPAAANLLARADALLSPDDLVRLEVMPDLGEALREIGDFEQAFTVLERATAQAAAAGDRRAEWRARAQSASARMHRRGTLEPLKELEEAARAFEDLGDATNVARTLRLVARAYLWLGRFGDAADAIGRALADVSAPRSLPQEVWLRRLRGEILFSGPEPLGEVVRYYESFRDWAREKGSRRGEEHALLQLARAHAMRGNFDQARELLADARAITSDLRLTVDGARDPAVAAGVVEMLAGDPVPAESAFRAGYDALAAMDERGFLSTLAVYLSHALYAQQRLDEAEQFAHISQEATPPGDVHPEVFIPAALAKIFASRGEHDRAIRLGREAVARADGSDYLLWQADARMDVAEVLRLAARPSDAAAAAEQAFRLYDQKGDVVSARRAREFRDQLVVT